MEIFNPKIISQFIQNSLENNSEGQKSGRLSGSSRSLKEAETGLTKRGSYESGRILIGLDDHEELIILDGRHLLEAFRLLNKKIPANMISFESLQAQELFIQHYQS